MADDSIMSLRGRFWRVELQSIFALLVCAFLVALYGLYDGVRMSLVGVVPLMSPIEAARNGFLYTLIFGFFPVTLYGAPLIAVILHLRIASWIAVVAIGIIPDTVISFIGERGLGGWFMLLGVVAASIIYAINRLKEAQG